jgi:hypothetical protein
MDEDVKQNGQDINEYTDVLQRSWGHRFLIAQRLENSDLK